MGNVAWATHQNNTFILLSCLNNQGLCLPNVYRLLSTPNAMQLLQGISYLVIAELMEQNIPADVDFLRHVSRNFVTTLC